MAGKYYLGKFVLIFILIQNAVFCLPIKHGNVMFEDPDLFEGDMIGFNEQTVEYLTNHREQFMSAHFQSEYKWPNAVIPYVFQNSTTKQFRQMIEDAMKEIHSVTCIRFVKFESNEKSNNVKPLYIWKERTCAATVGRDQAFTPYMTINIGCGKFGIVHELLHVIGFVHEQCREDRDRYILIHIENVIGNKSGNFQKYSFPFTIYTPYDYSSIMHYYRNAFSKERDTLITIEPLEDVEIGQRDQLSRFDKIKINKYYGCGEDVPECNDRLSAKECTEKGMGLNEMKILDPKKALCADEEWSKEHCPKTCGDCYRLFVQNKQK